MEIENVSRVSLTSRRTSNEQGKCTVSYRMLAQIVIYNEDISALFSEILSHSAARIRRNVLHGRTLGSRGGNYNRIFHCSRSLKILSELNHGSVLLTDSNIDTDNVLALLVDYRVNGDFGLTRLTVADDKLTLTSADGDHAVNCLDTRLKRNTNALALNNSGGFGLDRMSCLAINGSLAVNRLAECINDSAEKLLADGNRENPSRSADF